MSEVNMMLIIYANNIWKLKMLLICYMIDYIDMLYENDVDEWLGFGAILVGHLIV